jgi:hypothetical protein
MSRRKQEYVFEKVSLKNIEPAFTNTLIKTIHSKYDANKLPAERIHQIHDKMDSVQWQSAYGTCCRTCFIGHFSSLLINGIKNNAMELCRSDDFTHMCRCTHQLHVHNNLIFEMNNTSNQEGPLCFCDFGQQDYYSSRSNHQTIRQL